MTVFDPPIQQDDMSVLQLSAGADWKRIKPTGNRVLGRRLENPYEGRVWIPTVKKDDYGGKVEVLAVGPKAKDVQVGEIVLIGPYCDLEVDDLVIFQEADIRVVFVKPKDVYETPSLYFSSEYDRPCRVCCKVFSPKQTDADDYYSYCSQNCEFSGETGKERVDGS